MLRRVVPALLRSRQGVSGARFVSGGGGDDEVGAGSYAWQAPSRSAAQISKPMIIEARVNEYAPRDVNKTVPFTPREIAADAKECFDAGASIVHFHARNDDGTPAHDKARYDETIQAIRSACPEIMVHPTLGYVTLASKEQRMDTVKELCSDPATRPDFAPIDMGTNNVDRWDSEAKEYLTKSQTYTNTTSTLEFYSQKIREAGPNTYTVSWHLGNTRTIDSFIEAGLLVEPVYMLLCLTDGQCLAGHPGTLAGIRAHVDNIPADKRIEWTVCNFGGSIFPSAYYAIEEGGHLSPGLGDYGYPELDLPTNAELIKRCADAARSLGRPIATVAQAKELLDVRYTPGR